MIMTSYICATCGTHYQPSGTPPAVCVICADDRQYIGWDGQTWITHDVLAAEHQAHIEYDGDLLGIGVKPTFAIPQRALHLPTDAGNVLWETTSLVTADAVDELNRRGGVDMIAISHPHFYSGMVAWSDALGGVQILLHDADRQWVNCTSPNITFWTGDSHELSPTVHLYRCPGHFPGSTVLHWTAAPNDRRALLVGDALHVAQDRRHVAFMYSVPNHIPAHPNNVRETRKRLADVAFDDLYGFTWGLNIIGNARTAVDESFDRYFHAIGT
jgi:glyoxylase-like metal-dependent hydrolase (beta-lactamase superfamily II)